MAGKRTLEQHYPPRTRELIARGDARPERSRLGAVLSRIGARCRSSAATLSSHTGGVLYLDSSALVKLAVREPETAALGAELSRWPLCATSSITSIEVARATARARQQQPGVLPPSDVAALLSATVEMVLTDRVRDTASTLAPPELRTLDAIHVASALALGEDLAALVSYDVRMQRAAEHCRVRVLAPS
jgi:predicted nucleic acid-binding protein